MAETRGHGVLREQQSPVWSQSIHSGGRSRSEGSGVDAQSPSSSIKCSSNAVGAIMGAIIAGIWNVGGVGKRR